MIMGGVRNKYNIISFGLAILVFVIDLAFFGFQRTTSNLPRIILMYIILCIVYFIIELAGTGARYLKVSLKQFGISFLLSILQIAIPYLILTYLADIFGTLIGLIFFMLGIMGAPWIIYFLFINPPDFKFVAVVRVIWFIILLVIGLVYLGPAIVRGAEGVSVSTSLTVTPVDALKEFSVMLVGQFQNTRQSINQTLNAKLHPEGAKSQIDKDSKRRLGVFIDDLRLMFKNIIEGEPFDIIGTMEVNTIFDEIQITTKCFIESTTNSRVKVQGIQTEHEFFVLGQDSRILDCHLPAMAKGRYNTYFESNFKFETWAYLEYAFVNKDLALNFIRDGRDINKVLDIEKEYTPVFTDGPVQIMMIAANQPIIVDLGEGRSALPKFGIYLNRYWRTGEINSVNRIVVQMPKMINLTDCTPTKYKPEEMQTHPDTTEGSDYFHYYVFANNDKRPGALESFTCSIIIDKDLYQEEKQLNQKLEKTIVVSAIYDYRSESKKQLVNVIESRI